MALHRFALVRLGDCASRRSVDRPARDVHPRGRGPYSAHFHTPQRSTPCSKPIILIRLRRFESTPPISPVRAQVYPFRGQTRVKRARFGRIAAIARKNGSQMAQGCTLCRLTVCNDLAKRVTPGGETPSAVPRNAGDGAWVGLDGMRVHAYDEYGLRGSTPACKRLGRNP